MTYFVCFFRGKLWQIYVDNFLHVWKCKQVYNSVVVVMVVRGKVTDVYYMSGS